MGTKTLAFQCFELIVLSPEIVLLIKIVLVQLVVRMSGLRYEVKLKIVLVQLLRDKYILVVRMSGLRYEVKLV